MLHFIFFREHGVVLSDWSQSPELQITALWRQDSGVYRCGAASAQGVRKYSLPLQVSVQGECGRATGWGWRGCRAVASPTPTNAPFTRADGDCLPMGAADTEK